MMLMYEGTMWVLRPWREESQILMSAPFSETGLIVAIYDTLSGYCKLILVYWGLVGPGWVNFNRRLTYWHCHHKGWSCNTSANSSVRKWVSLQTVTSMSQVCGRLCQNARICGISSISRISIVPWWLQKVYGLSHI